MMEKNKLYKGDCLEVMRNFPDHCVDLIISDPPYGVLNKSNPNAQWDKEVDLKALWAQYKRVVKPNGAILLFGQGLFAAKLIMSNPKWFKFDFVWDKVRKSNFLNCKRMPMRQHEQVLVFYKKPPTYNPQMVYTGPHQRNHNRGKGSDEQTNNCFGRFRAAETIISDYKYPGTIVKFSKGHGKEDWMHSTAKPVSLLRWLIRTYSNEGDLILDSFAGSGSTLVAAIDEKRDWVGIELSEKYYEICEKRIKDRLREPTLYFDKEDKTEFGDYWGKGKDN